MSIGYFLEVFWHVENMPRHIGPFDTRAEAEDYARLNVPNGVATVYALAAPYLKAEYTPTTAEVRERFIDGFPMDTWVVARAEVGDEFDAWLAGVRAQTIRDEVGSDVMERRIVAAIMAAAVSREVVQFEWPECHRKNCQQSHGDPDRAFGAMKHQIAEAVKDEIHYHATTRPDVSLPEDAPESVAVYTLAELLNRYNVHHTGTFVKAARLIVEAYPAIVPPLVPAASESER